MNVRIAQQWNDTAWWFTKVLPRWTNSVMDESIAELIRDNASRSQKKWTRYHDYP